MRIAHVTATFPPHYTGTGNVCYQNALGLAERGHEVRVFTAGPGERRERIRPGLTVHRLPALWRVGNAPLLPGLLRLPPIDLIHLHYPFYFGAELVSLVARARRIPLVVTYHQDVLFDSGLRYPERLHHALVGRPLLGRATRLLATSWDYARASRLAEWVDGAAGRLDVLPNGVDVERFRPALPVQALRSRYGLPEEAPVALFVGGLDRAHFFKGVVPLLRAFRATAPAAHLLIVGEGELRSRYEAEAARLGLTGRVRFCGRVPARELAAHYVLADLLVLPSLTMGEAFGMVLLEAMACARPVIASALPGVRSVVGEGEDGFLVAPGDVPALGERLAWLLDQRVVGHEMGRRGREKVERLYAWPRVIDRLESIYREVRNS